MSHSYPYANSTIGGKRGSPRRRQAHALTGPIVCAKRLRSRESGSIESFALSCLSRLRDHGRLIYETNIDIGIDDNVLANLDLTINMLQGVQLCIQISGLGGAHDGNLISLHFGPGILVTLEHLNSQDIDIDIAAVTAAEKDARSVGVFELKRFRPFA